MHLLSTGEVNHINRSLLDTCCITRPNKATILLNRVRKYNDFYLQSLNTMLVTNLGVSRETTLNDGCGLSYSDTSTCSGTVLDTNNSIILSNQILIRRLNGTRTPSPS